MAKSIFATILAYSLTLFIVLLLPVQSEEYNTLFWRIMIGQIYAIPCGIIFFIIFYSIYKEKQKKK